MIVKMDKLTVLGLEDQRKALVAALMDLGVVEISSAEAEEYEDMAQNPAVQDELSRIENQIADVKNALETLNRYCPQKSGLFPVKREITVSEFNNILGNSASIMESVKTIKEEEERLAIIKTEENRLNNLQMALIPWKDSDIQFEVTGTRKTTAMAGTIPAAVDWSQVENGLAEKAPYSAMEKINADKDQYYVYVICHNEMEQECLSYLKTVGFNKVSFQGLSGTVLENFGRIERRLRELSDEREIAVEKIKSFKKSKEYLETYYDSLCMERDRIIATGKILKTKRAFLIKGWVPEKLALAAKERLESKFTVSVEIAEPAEDEEFPVLLENKGIAEAGEPVTNMYSLPNCREIDPNAVMAPFFIMFFGLMLSDGGYGIIMALAAAYVLRRYKLDDGKRKFIKLIFCCGLATIFWGAMFGGWFGIEALAKYRLWLNPVEQPELLLSWSLLFGVIHIYAGIGLRTANLIREKKYLDALLDAGSSYIYYTGFILVLLPYVPEVDKDAVAPLVNAGKYVFIAGAVFTLLTQGRDRKNIIGKFVGGLSSLYNIAGFMSDVLSYSRLLALGLATGIIGTIINQIGVMFNFPVIFKIISAAVIFLIGHAINFAINALGAYVHSCRLQYLEFFGKFYTGGGEAFKPLRANTKYIEVKPNAGN